MGVVADHLQVCDVLWTEKFVVSQLARNEDAVLLDRLARPRILIRELSDFPSGRIGVDIARLDPLVSGPAWVAGGPKPAGYTLTRAQHCHQPQNRRGARERAQLLDIHPRVAVPLVSVRVGVALEISKAKPRSVRPAPHLVLIVVSRPDRPIDLPASLDRLEELPDQRKIVRLGELESLIGGLGEETFARTVGGGPGVPASAREYQTFTAAGFRRLVLGHVYRNTDPFDAATPVTGSVRVITLVDCVPLRINERMLPISVTRARINPASGEAERRLRA